MANMKAAICTKYGPPEVVKIQERPKPTPKDGEVLIRVKAATVTLGCCQLRGMDYPALMKPMARLLYGINRPRQPVFGYELSGQVETAGKNVQSFKVGDEVFALTSWLKMGTHAEYVAVPERKHVVLKPDNISHEQASAISYGGITALYFLRKANLQRRQKILIFGASGSVGTSAVQLAKYFGAEVTGVCSGKNADFVKSIGADHIIDYTVEDFRNGKERYDVVFDTMGSHVAGSLSKSSTKSVLTANGRFVSVSGGIAKENLEDLQFLATLAQDGHFTPVIDRTYPFEQIVEAYKYVGTGRKRGNVVLKISE